MIKGEISLVFKYSDWDELRAIKNFYDQYHRNKQVRQESSGVVEGQAEGSEAYQQILDALKQRFGTQPFKLTDAISLVELFFKKSSSTTIRVLKRGKEEGKLRSDKKGIYVFLESGLTPGSTSPAADSTESKDVTISPAST